VVREGVGQGGEMTQALYAHMNNKTIKNKKIIKIILKIPNTNKGWWSGSSGRKPAWQVEDPEFKPQYCKK
jgi:hypothetical protein